MDRSKLASLATLSYKQPIMQHSGLKSDVTLSESVEVRVGHTISVHRAVVTYVTRKERVNVKHAC